MKSASGVGRRIRSWILLGLLALFLAGCAATGRGEFPNFDRSGKSEHDLAVLPTVGAVSQELNSSILYHLDRQGLEKTFRSVRFIPAREARRVLGTDFTIDWLSTGPVQGLDELTDSRLVLGMQVNQFSVEEFTTTETRTLYRTNTEYSNTSVYSSDSGDGNNSGSNGRNVGPGDGPGRRVGPPDSGDSNSGNGDSSDNTFITRTESQTSSRQIPVTRGNIRVVLSMSAVIYDRQQNRVVWRGQRIERAQDELEDLSSLELKDIVVERVLYRLNNRLVNG